MSEIYDDLGWKPNLNTNEKPIYLAIAKALEKDIKKSILKPGDKLPPQRELADFLHVNLTTVTKALKICERKGIIFATVGKGTYVSSNLDVLTSYKGEKAENEKISLGMLHPYYGINESIMESVRLAIQDNKMSRYLEYDDPYINMAHCEFGAEWLKRFRIYVDVENVFIASGAQNALAVTLISLFQPGDKIATDCFTYTGFRNLANLFGIRLVPIEMSRDGINIESLERACKNDDIKGLYIIPECQNPTTCTISLSNRQRIANMIKKNDIILIEDDTYSFLNNSEYPPISEFIKEQSIYISSISKSLSVGLRVAFMAVAPKFKNLIHRGIYSINLNTSHFNVEIVSRLVESGLADRILIEKRQESEVRNKIVDDILGDYDIWGNKRDYFRWLILPSGWTGREFELCAKMSGVEVFCEEHFLIGSDYTKAAVRIATASAKNRQELMEGLTILKKLLRNKPDETSLII